MGTVINFLDYKAKRKMAEFVKAALNQYATKEHSKSRALVPILPVEYKPPAPSIRAIDPVCDLRALIEYERSNEPIKFVTFTIDPDVFPDPTR